MSGKGGVGKSFVTAGLSAAFQKKGYKVGILDADITGSSIPKMLGLSERLQVLDGKIIPAQTRLGIKVVSLNLILESEDEAVIWRGPLISNAIKQLYEDSYWNKTEILFIDLPPGTSDAALTVLQTIIPEGIVLITSPQDLVNLIVRKALNMARKVKANIIGLLENMTYVTCSHCGEKLKLFGDSSGKKEAEKAGLEFLGSLPLDPEITRLCDKGEIESLDKNYFSEPVEKIERFLNYETK